jgi:RHS repeat-associated protein
MRVRNLLVLAASFMMAVPVYAAISATRTSAFEYDPASGLLTKEVIEPDNANLCLVTTYAYDAFGNKTSATTSNCSGASGDAVIESRTSSTAYDAQGRFATSSTNALSQSETRVFNARFGGVENLTGPNSLTTQWTYDAFGRKASETRADGTTTTWTYTLCGTCPANGAYFVTQSSTASPTAKVYYDRLNREIRSETQGFDGTAVYKDTQYDALGRVVLVSKPYYAGQSILWTGFGYDLLGRVIDEMQSFTMAGGVRITTAYSGLATTVTVSNSYSGTNLPGNVTQAKTTVKNSQGQTVSVTDAQGNVVRYYYDPFGNLTVTNAGGVYTSLGYDLRGRKISMSDPDMGDWSYAYDALSQLKRQTDAKNQVTTMAYDKLGRMLNRSETGLVSTWTYDACTKGVGKLCQAASDNGYSRTLTYDSLGRVASIATFMDATYTISYGYDGNGRLVQTTYPTGFVTRNAYTSLGYLQKVTDAGGALTYWQANTVSATGKVLNETLGNGLTSTSTYDELERMRSNIVAGSGGTLQNFSYTYDTIGNLTQRVDAVQGITESFVYDTLNRLLQASGSGLSTRSLSYNALGNVTYKSDAGTYTYPVPGDYRPHAVASIAGTVNGVANPTFSYDANGNLTSGLNRTLTYTSFNMPATVTAPNNMLPNTNVTYQYTYNAEHERVRHIITRSDGVFTTFYLHPAGKGQLLYEKEVKPSVTEHKHYITAGSLLIGVYISRSDATTETRYFHRDHLGSLTLITNDSGGQIERFAYEAFGKRRFPNGTADPNNTIFGVTTDRGFTSHEHLDEMGLIHMNGRVYDPLLGRFMTADPNIQSPADLQAYNRYTYVLNNPLMYTDPTGYWGFNPFRAVRDIVGGIADAVSSVVRSDVGKAIAAVAIAYGIGYGLSLAGSETFVSSWTTTYTAGQVTSTGFTLTAAGSAVVGAGTGFSLGLINSGGDIGTAFNGAFKGAVVGGIFGAATQFTADWNGVNGAIGRAAVKAVAGGMSSQLLGGRFADGFGAGLFAGGASEAYRYVTTYAPDPLPGKELPSGDGTFPESLGVVPKGYAVFGNNDPTTGNFFQDFAKQGGALGRLANSVPVINSGAAFHDSIFVRQIFGMTKSWLTNIPTILPTAIITIGANVDGPLAVQLSNTGKRGQK